jgi:hypothetical protein
MGLMQTLSALARRGGGAPGVDEVLAKVDLLAAEGRSLQALNYAAAHAARLDDMRLWARFGPLRMAAAPEAVALADPRPAWPPDLPDPFPGHVGLPEIAADALTWRILGGAILHHGSLLVRGLIDPAMAERLRAGIDAALEGYDAFYAPEGGTATPAYLPVPVPDTEALEATRPWTRESGGVWAAESPRLFQTVLDLFQARGVIDAVGGYLGERPLLSVGKTVFRRAEPDTSGIFHQDGAFMGADIRTVNVWTALSPCGEDAPGLEVVARRLPSIVETGTPGAIFHWAVGRPGAERAADGAPIVSPVFAAGDALIFDQLMLHATGVKPGMSRRRYALESWFFAPTAYAADQVPIVI